MRTQSKQISGIKWILLITGMLYCSSKAGAQVLPEYSAFPTSSIGLQFGEQGVGLSGSFSFARSFEARLGFSAVPDITVLYNSRNLKIDRTAVYALADWQPLYGNYEWFARKWFISTGFGYYFTNQLYREGMAKWNIPNYYTYLSRYRPYIGTGLGNIHLVGELRLRLDLGTFIPTNGPISGYENKTNTIVDGLKGALPGLNTAATFYIKF